MCYFISLVVNGGDVSEIDRLLRCHGRQAMPFENPSVCELLSGDEILFLTTVEHCDCGTALAHSDRDADPHESGASKQVAKLAKKGWSSAKIQRWVSDRSKAEERRNGDAPDSLELWAAIISELMAIKGVREAGLMLHFYAGVLETEVIKLTRTEVPLCEFASYLGSIGEDQLLMARV